MHVDGADGHDLLPVALGERAQQQRDQVVQLGDLLLVIVLSREGEKRGIHTMTSIGLSNSVSCASWGPFNERRAHNIAVSARLILNCPNGYGSYIFHLHLELPTQEDPGRRVKLLCGSTLLLLHDRPTTAKAGISGI